jgi:hypothetical protein
MSPITIKELVQDDISSGIRVERTLTITNLGNRRRHIDDGTCTLPRGVHSLVVVETNPPVCAVNLEGKTLRHRRITLLPGGAQVEISDKGCSSITLQSGQSLTTETLHLEYSLDD